MRVAMYYNNRDVRLEEMPEPKIGPGELMVRVRASGICGSDVLEWYRIHKAPLVLGHEIAGDIVKIGQGLAQYKLGDRVSASHHVPCNRCYYCLRGHHTACDTLRSTNFDPGGFAEFVRLPAINVDRGLYPLPDEVSYEEATFIEPLACVVRGQMRSGLKPGQSVLIIGSGIAGLLNIKLARASGAARIFATDLHEYRLKAARRFGACAAFHAEEDVPARLRQVNDGRLADLAIVCTGAVPAITQALRSVERGGTILFFAPTEADVTIPISINDFFFRSERTLMTSYAGSPADHLIALELIRTGTVQVKEMITHRLSLEQAGFGFHLVAKAQDSIKVIIEP